MYLALSPLLATLILRRGSRSGMFLGLLVQILCLSALLRPGTCIRQGADFGALVKPWNGTLEIASGGPLDQFEGELLVIGVYAAESGDVPFAFSDAVKAFDAKYAEGILTEAADEEGFTGVAGTFTNVIRLRAGKVKRVILYGMGSKAVSAPVARQFASFAVQAGMQIRSCRAVGVFIEQASPSTITSVVDGGIMGGFVDERYKGRKEVTPEVPEKLLLIGIDLGSVDNKVAVSAGMELAMGVISTKQLTASPAHIVTPGALADAARMIASDSGLEIEVLGRDQCSELGMGSYLSVGQGSIYEPQFIHLTYKPKGEVKKKIAFVGKTITFDSGGYNLKIGSGSDIELMHFDMAGGGAVLGSAKVVGKLKPENVEVHFIMPAVENMINGKATHPGDIFMASNGKTVEVVNTDAEGRLALADALVFTEKIGGFDYIVDIATLTGSISSALGDDIVGVFSPSDELAKTLIECGKTAGELLWQMPLAEEYRQRITSVIADIQNVQSRSGGGSITAALFLREFVENPNWAHLDIAGPIWGQGRDLGFGVRTFVNFVNKISAEA